MKVRFLLVFTIFLMLPAILKGQKSDDEKKFVSVPEHVMREVVRRILIYNFKPAKRHKVVYIAKKGIESAWLPEIPNVEFRLASDEEIEDDFEEIYFFTEPESSNKTYSIGFAFGDPGCYFSGNSWNFRFTSDKVRLWIASGFGGGCAVGGGSGGEFKTPGQLNAYPNELNGYKFYDRGKLRGLRLSISTSEDVKKNFGDDCRSSCEYDQNWKVSITYFNDFHRETTVEDKRIKIVAKEEYNDKIYSISFRPKNKILFDKIVFPRNFRKSRVHTASHDGMGGGENSTHDIYFDRFGLKYSVLDEISLTTVKDRKWRKGELTSIEYAIPEKLEETMFVEEK